MQSMPNAMPKEVLDLKADFDKMKGKLKARLLDEKGKKIKDVDVKDLLTTLEKNKKKVGTIMFDGIITKRLVEAAEQKEIATIVGAKRGAVSSAKVNIYTL
jgi:HKD family nuclease